jgi:C1A family cysteine protease
MIKIALALFALNTLQTLPVVSAGTYKTTIRPAIVEFNDFTTRYNKTYDTDEYDLRYDIFRNNLERIREHNRGNYSWKMGVNAFTDLTAEEFRMRYLGFNFGRSLKNTPRLTDYSLKTLRDVPRQVDWRQKGVVNAVKNQGQCGSCWAFSTIGSVESAWAIKTGKLYSLSEQQLVDCSGSFGNQGCNGGLMDDAFQYAEKNALCSEDNYPYNAQDGTCKSSCKGLVNVQSYVDIPAGDENALLQAVATKGPVSVAIEADQSAFQFYSSGVLDGDCGRQLDHGVVVVGYGDENSKPYWLVRNSWGDSWGEQGYIKIVRNQDKCGIADSASYPVV